MLKHSETLENTEMWKSYEKKISIDTERSNWIKKVYKTAVVYLNDVRQNFINYTLHDGTHVLNVLDAMGGLLGDYIEKLSEGEMELLILAACLHDLGMVYTEEEKNSCFEDEARCKAFLREHCPELLGCASQEWSEDTRQWYLRILHPFRLSEVLQNKEWEAIFDDCPVEIISKKCIVAVCQAHGEESKELRSNENLDYLPASDTDPLFCALLLRLADLLDFDDTRAPKVLYKYAECNDKSRDEWDKHQASAGFYYPPTPSTDDLPYKARCKNPMIEHAVREFLDWIDSELSNCMRLQKYCEIEWQKNFPFPRAVSRKEIESVGYMSGDFCLTMNQEQIMNLLMGENLYENQDVFVRELLQNAIDATLLRGEMDSSFIPEQSHIDIWEWNDKEGNFWFRIDDQGTGMTLGMLQRYLLKVGNSYYTSQELERDLRDHGQFKKYQAISRFGIGFLSCFLCGDNVEVSTLYFDPEKNRREQSMVGSSHIVNYGLRLQVTGLTGYYTLKNQAENHPTDDQLPLPECYDARGQSVPEQWGYRAKPGTSIVIRLNPGKMGSLNLREAVEKYLYGARVPVYYNKNRVGKTYDEVMSTVHEMAGEKLYELTPELKKQFDSCFPEVCGQYPKLKINIVPFDTGINQALPGFSGALFMYDVCFEQIPQWNVEDQIYRVTHNISYPSIGLQSYDVNFLRSGHSEWGTLFRDYQFDDARVINLKEKLQTFKSCPKTEAQLGEVWIPFSKKYDLYTVWTAYQRLHNENFMEFDATDCGCPNIYEIFGISEINSFTYAYQGIATSKNDDGISYRYNAIVLLEGELKPEVEISRSKILSLPLKALLAISGIFDKYCMHYSEYEFKNWKNVSLRQWRELRNTPLGQWVNRTQADYLKDIKLDFMGGCYIDEVSGYRGIYINHGILDKYFMAYLQDSHDMIINYEEGEVITFYEKTEDESEDIYGIFPPMMFCKAASDQSRQYICYADDAGRRGITVDHPFVVWLLENSIQLNEYFYRQFSQIIECLCNKGAGFIIGEVNAIREQLLSLTDCHGVDIGSMPLLCDDDFWFEDEDENEDEDDM